MSPIRVSEAVRCGRPSRRVRAAAFRAIAQPVIRSGRIQQHAPAARVHEFAESDYCYGVGSLILRVDHIDRSRPVPLEGEVWFAVNGVVIDRAGREGARRRVLVRARQLPEPPPPRKRPRLRP